MDKSDFIVISDRSYLTLQERKTVIEAHLPLIEEIARQSYARSRDFKEAVCAGGLELVLAAAEHKKKDIPFEDYKAAFL